MSAEFVKVALVDIVVQVVKKPKGERERFDDVKWMRRPGLLAGRLDCVMAPKRRSDKSDEGKSVKKSKEGEVAVIRSDLEDEGIRNGVKEAWRRKTSFCHGVCRARVVY